MQAGADCGCEHLVLTHFSQRYPKVPALGHVLAQRTGVAFDLMGIRLSDLTLPAAVLPVLRALFADGQGDGADGVEKDMPVDMPSKTASV